MTRSMRFGALTLLVVTAACSGGSGKTFRVMSCNMAPALLPGYHVHVAAASGHIKRSDIVYYLPPASSRRSADDLRVARVVGMPGDHLEARDNRVFVNGAPDSEAYLPAGTLEPGLRPQDVPAGSYFVMGDNRGNSLDSRVFGPMKAADVRYRATSISKDRPKADDIGCFGGPGAPTGRSPQG